MRQIMHIQDSQISGSTFEFIFGEPISMNNSFLNQDVLYQIFDVLLIQGNANKEKWDIFNKLILVSKQFARISMNPIILEKFIENPSAIEDSSFSFSSKTFIKIIKVYSKILKCTKMDIRNFTGKLSPEDCDTISQCSYLSFKVSSPIFSEDSYIEKLASNSKRIKTLCLNDCSKLTNSSLFTLANFCSNLESLTLHKLEKVSDDAIIYLSKECLGLKTINFLFKDSEITDKGISKLIMNCNELKKIKLYGINKNISDNVFTNGQSLKKYKLEHITLSLGKGSKMTGKLIDHLSNQFAGIKEFIYNSIDFNITNSHINKIANNWKSLEKLELYNSSSISADYLLLNNFSNLKHLKFSGLKVNSMLFLEDILDNNKIEVLEFGDDCEFECEFKEIFDVFNRHKNNLKTLHTLSFYNEAYLDKSFSNLDQELLENLLPHTKIIF